jgi:uncharacterized protein (DUF2141 family)
MRPSLHLALPLVLATALLAPPPSDAQQSDSSTFELHGTVINAVTGQPVSGALIQLNGQQAGFSASDGTFSFTDLTRGQYGVTARKPGFFTQPEVRGGDYYSESLQIVPSAADVTVKLFPEGIIYGDVKNDAGDPLEGISVQIQRWEAQNGRRVLQQQGESSTDDEGNFRLSELTPGSYYIVFQQRDGRRMINRNARGRNASPRPANEGVGLQYYPGVADASSATPVTILSGTQLHISQILSPLRLFQISGIAPAAALDGGLAIELLNSSGGNAASSTRLDRQTGQFHVDGIPAGNYLLRANLWHSPNADNETPRTPVVAWLPISVTSDINGLVLPFGNSTSIPIQVHDETTTEVSSSNNARRVFVSMSAKDFPQLSFGEQSPHIPNDEGSTGVIEQVPPTTYSVEATPQFEGYVSDLRCGSIDLFQHDLTVSPGASLPAIEVTVRDDGAELDAAITENGQPANGSVIVFSENYPRRSIVMNTEPGPLSVTNLAPGTYEVVAVKDASQVEFTNPTAMAKYLAHATTVTLGPHAKSAVQLELQSVEAQP